MSADLSPYEAVVLVSFGGPEKEEDVVPFLENVTRGRGIPRERLAQVGEHYNLFGGKSPINDQCRILLDALRTELAGRGLDLPVTWGNRNWTPYLAETFAELDAAGHRRVLAITTSAYPSYSSCRQYREDLFGAVGDSVIQVDRIRNYANHPGFVTASVDATLNALGELGESAGGARLVFVTHSIPSGMAAAAGPGPHSTDGAYVDWHREVAAEVTRQVAATTQQQYEFDLVYCSRSGPPTQPWLEPDINDHLADLSEREIGAVVCVPIGFISDHMEVIYDLDTEAAATADKLGLGFVRAATAGTHPAFVSALVDLALERAAVARGDQADAAVINNSTPGLYACPVDCCVNLNDPGKPALCGAALAGASKS